MTDQKLTDLSDASLPLDGEELLYAVQSGNDVKVKSEDLPISTATQTALDGKLSNITGLVTAGSNVTITGSGTSLSPYVINSSGGGGGRLSR